MARNVLPQTITLKPAKRGSKKGWRTRATQLPPEVDARLEAYCLARRQHPTDAIREAVEAHLGRAA